MTGDTPSFELLNFANVNVPQPTESRNTSDETIVTWGPNNQYPAFLIDLYTESAIHSAVINGKTNHILGDGLQVNEGTTLDVQVNASDSIHEFTAKVTKDYLIFNAFAVEVLYGKDLKPVEFHHIPLHKIRSNMTKFKFWYSDDWLLRSKGSIVYSRYNPNAVDGTSQLFFFDGYFPSINNVYPTPEYIPSVKAIMTDAAIDDFNLNNIKNHFSISTHISYFNGDNLSKEEQKDMVRKLNNSYKGEFGKKFIVSFNSKEGKAPEVQTIPAGDWDKGYMLIQQAITDKIMIGHTAHPGIFNIQTPGKLGSSQELEIAYEIYKGNYVSVKRNEIESALNQLFKNFPAINGKVKFVDKPLFQTQLTDDTKMRVFTINELRELGGKKPLPDGDRLLDVQPAAIIQQSKPDKLKKKSSNERQLTEADFETIKHLGLSVADFEILQDFNNEEFHFDKENKIADYIIGNDIRGLTMDELIEVLRKEGKIKTTAEQVKNVLDTLSDAGLAEIDIDEDNRIKVTPTPKPTIEDTGAVSVMYQYRKRPEVTGGDLLPTSRGFCVKVINNNRLYTREDIQEMSALFGYDIYKHTGGWYYNPELDEKTNYCRHYWQAVKVKKRA